jgi:acyl-CoA dehydrogenase
LTRPFLKKYRRLLPSMSATEREALDAGTVWWDGELFTGGPDWRKLMSAKVPVLTPTEQAFLDGPCEQLCAMLDDWDITHRRADMPPEVWAFIKAQGFFAMIIPKRYGGLEFSAYAHSCVLIKVASRSATAPPPSRCQIPWGPPSCCCTTVQRRKRTITCRVWHAVKTSPALH